MTAPEETASSAMDKPARIVILIGEHDDFDGINYFVKEFIKSWHKQGLEAVVHRGLGNPPAADIALLHVDLTITPQDYLTLIQTYPKVINGKVADISKTKISDRIVRRNGGYHGKVIVKTNNNCAGFMENRLAMERGGLAALLCRLRRILPWYCRSYLSEYPIFDSPSKVPFLLWFNHDLVIERFETERQGDYYCLRTWFFLGDQEMHSLSYSTDPVIKARKVVRREPLRTVPPELRAIREKMGFDYGKFDYAMIDGRVVLYDVNRTPGLGGKNPNPEFLKNVETLSQGIRFYL